LILIIRRFNESESFIPAYDMSRTWSHKPRSYLISCHVLDVIIICK